MPVIAVVVAIMMTTVTFQGAESRDGTVLTLACPPCNDFDPCTIDSCDESLGTCRHDALDCDDGNPCTQDWCAADACNHTPRQSGACDDLNQCTESDACESGQCVGLPLSAGTACDDGNSCTTGDVCDAAAECHGVPSLPGTECDDGSACTGPDFCTSGVGGSVSCVGESTDCDDGNPCTDDGCDPLSGSCVQTPINCSDGNECTDDGCDPATGACIRTFVSGPCEDGSSCTVSDMCDAGNCIGGPVDCDDENDCTLDMCNVEEGYCYYEPLSHYPCDDGNACTYFDECVGATCYPGTEWLDCNDYNVCTTEWCDSDVGCVYEPIAAPCDDGNACTVAEVCDGGVCAGGEPLSCDDGNVCTDDACDPETGCLYTFNTSPCDDGNYCTVGDVCSGGLCAGTPACTCPDDDADGYADCTIVGCDASGLVCGDCDDGDALVHPDSAETCNQRDDDCNGQTDETSERIWVGRKVLDPEGLAGDQFGSAVALVGDVTGDGIPDLAVGAPGVDTELGDDVGAVLLLSGSDQSVICRCIDPGAASGDRLGTSVAMIGDLDGDGISDLIAGAPGGRSGLSPSRGKVLAFSGADCTPILACSDSYWTSCEEESYRSIGFSVSGVGDITGDGVPEIVAGDPFARECVPSGPIFSPVWENGKTVVFSGTNCAVVHRLHARFLLEEEHNGFGVLGFDDVTGDQVPDLVVLEEGGSELPGFVLVYSGSDGSRVRTMQDPTANSERVLLSLSSMPDITGDGLSEILVGESFYYSSSVPGAAIVFSALDGTMLRKCTDPEGVPEDILGSAVTGLPDITGDGLPEIGVSAPRDDTLQGVDTGSIVIFSSADCSVVARLIDPAGAPGAHMGERALAFAEDSIPHRPPKIVAGSPLEDVGSASEQGSIVLFAFEADCDGDGFTPSAGDCDDADPHQAPGLTEVCDGKDNDCDGLIDEDLVPGEDQDGDGVEDCSDNCPFTANPDQADGDGDGLGDACDGCPDDAANDADGDGVCGDVDNCPMVANPGQEDGDGDGLGDACDACPDDAANDADDDGVCGDVDNCPAVANPGQEDGDGDGLGDACDACPGDAANDADDDGVCGDVDNCPAVANSVQEDGDGDGLGDACDACPGDAANDADGDGVCGDVDNCPAVANPGQEDGDGDGLGDACDACPDDAANDADGDGVCGGVDNCPAVANPGQEDEDQDGFGDHCDNCPTVPNVDQNPCVCNECFPLDITISFVSDLGKGSGTVSWRTGIEHDVMGFNVVVIDSRGNRVQQNVVIIPCQECTTDAGSSYGFIIPKHRSGRNIFVEQIHLDGRVESFGPAVKISEK